MDHEELTKRLKDKAELGWDECSATGTGHNPENHRQSDGKFYCQYCGAELLPEEQGDMDGTEA